MSGVLERLAAPALRRYRVRRLYLTPRRLSWPLERIAIDRPVFFLGVQGGGLTILLKCFQRLSGTCFCMGDHRAWDAADNEMHVCVQDPQMPPELSFNRSGVYPDGLPSDFYRYWTYATDAAIERFRLPPEQVTPQIRGDFRAVLKKMLRAHAEDPNACRLIDKSQLYTINIPALERILDDTTPMFVLVARSPLGSVPRAARNYYLNPKKHGFEMAYERALRLCAEHWRNSFQTALDDGAGARRFMTLRIEDFFADAEPFLRKICDFAELEFDPEMVPGPDQAATIYQQMGRRWWPIKRSTTDKAAAALSPLEREIIDEICGPTMEALGYALPD